ncbi:MAG: single-stranded-DNA-specific exonuclease RecJ, partial [Muribaculaceae bacterium]|nr:single-stranded-DNA-specific exonuclease RecJ [Muribaculaceae bacterium]
EHIKLDVIDPSCGKMMNGIAFGMSEYYERIKNKEPFDIIYTVEENRHRNTVSIQLLIKDIRMSNDAPEE